jgi:hypothetical protein
MKHVDKSGEVWYGIHEYYTVGDGDDWTEQPVRVLGESPEEVKEILGIMLRDIERHGVKDYDQEPT